MEHNYDLYPKIYKSLNSPGANNSKYETERVIEIQDFFIEERDEREEISK